MSSSAAPVMSVAGTSAPPDVPLPSLDQPPVLTDALVNSTAATGASFMTSTLGMSFLMLSQPFFSAGSLGPLSSFQPYGLLLYGLSTPSSMHGRYASPMDGLIDLTMPSSSFGLTSFGDPITPSFGGLYAGGASTSTLAPPIDTSQTYL
jgi:hypothetical protein